MSAACHKRTLLILASAALVLGPEVVPARADLLISNLGDGNIVRYDFATGLVTTFIAAGSGGLDSPVGMRYGADGYLYVTNQNTSEVLRYNGNTGAFKDVFVAAGSGGLSAPADLRFGPGGDLFVSSLGGTQVLRFDGTTGASEGAFTHGAGDPLMQPNVIRFHSDGMLYVSSLGTASVERYDGTTGAYVDSFITPGSGGLLGATAHAFGPDGNFYIADVLAGDVRRYDGFSGAPMGVFAAGPIIDPMSGDNVTYPTGLMFAPDGFLYVTSQGAASVLKYSYDATSATFTGTFIPTGTPPSQTSAGAQPGLLLLTPIAGDVNADGLVDIFDINSVSSHWGSMGPGGDANGDGLVDIFDINLISANWNQTGGGSATAVPEPSTFVLACAAAFTGLVLARRRRAACRPATDRRGLSEFLWRA
jgi:sugar lactone lactonase YvrE